MKYILAFITTGLLASSNAFAIMLICDSPQKDHSGKSAKVYRFNSKVRTMEEWIYTPAKTAGYLLFNVIENLDYQDELSRMHPLRRVISAMKNGKSLLYAYQSLGEPFFYATIINENPTTPFQCRWKE